MVVIAFRVRWGLASSSINTGIVVKVKDDNGLQDVPLISWLIKIALNSDHGSTCIHAKRLPIPSQNHRQLEGLPRCCLWNRSAVGCLVLLSVMCRRKRLSSDRPVLHDWCNKGRGMCYPVCGMVHIKEPLLLIGKSSLCGGSGFPLSLSEWSFTICLTPYNRI